MVPSFLSGRSVENGHNLLNFGEQGSQTRQVIYVADHSRKQSKGTQESIGDVTVEMTSSISIQFVPFRTYTC